LSWADAPQHDHASETSSNAASVQMFTSFAKVSIGVNPEMSTTTTPMMMLEIQGVAFSGGLG
jgi:hypothetical protein